MACNATRTVGLWPWKKKWINEFQRFYRCRFKTSVRTWFELAGQPNQQWFYDIRRNMYQMSFVCTVYPKIWLDSAVAKRNDKNKTNGNWDRSNHEASCTHWLQVTSAQTHTNITENANKTNLCAYFGMISLFWQKRMLKFKSAEKFMPFSENMLNSNRWSDFDDFLSVCHTFSVWIHLSLASSLSPSSTALNLTNKWQRKQLSLRRIYERFSGEVHFAQETESERVWVCVFASRLIGNKSMRREWEAKEQ